MKGKKNNDICIIQGELINCSSINMTDGVEKRCFKLTSYDKNDEGDYGSPILDFVGVKIHCRHAYKSFVFRDRNVTKADGFDR